jgi:sigma-B regulation protein RsbU (phosphoserine phosphatase)
MDYVNKLLCKESVSSMFVTVFYGILDIQNGELEYVNAGHNTPYVISAGGISKIEMTNGLALGVLEDFIFQSKKIQLKKGESLLLYTDGVTEAFDKHENAYGESRFEDFLFQNRSLPIEATIKKLFTEISVFVEDAAQSDDITLLGITFKG